MTFPRNIALGVSALWVVLLLGATLQALSAASLPADRILRIAHLRDPSATLGIAQITDRPFAASDTSFLGGYDDAAHWFRLTVAPPTDTGDGRGTASDAADDTDADDTVLQLSLNQLDHVTLYLPDAQGWKAVENGDTVPFDQRGAKLLPISFLLPDAALGQPVYLRVQSTSSLSFQLWATTLTEAEHNLARQIALHVIYFSLLGMGVLLAALRLRLMPNRLSLSLFAFMAVYFVYSAEVLGYAPILLPLANPLAHSRLTDASALLTVLASMLFHRNVLGQHRPNRFMLAATDTLIGAQALLFVPLIGGQGSVIGLPSMALSLAALVLVLGMLSTLRITGRTARRTLYLAYATWFCVTAVWLCSRLGLFSAATLSRPYVEVFGLNSLFIALTVMALDRTAHLQRERSTRLSLASAHAMQEANSRNATEQEGFTHMLVHELRNNLIVLQMSLPEIDTPAQREALAATIRDLDRSLAEARHSTWLTQGNWPDRPRPLVLVEILDRVLDGLGAADRIDLGGDDAEALVVADPELLAAALSATLNGLCSLARPDAPIRLTLSQDGRDSPCTLLCETAPASPLPDTPALPPQFTLGALLLRRLGGAMSLAFAGPDLLRLELVLAANPTGLPE